METGRNYVEIADTIYARLERIAQRDNRDVRHVTNRLLLLALKEYPPMWDPNKHSDVLSEATRHLLRGAGEEAEALKNSHIGTGDLLLAFLRDLESPIAQMLMKLGVEYNATRVFIGKIEFADKIDGNIHRTSPEEFQYSPDTREILGMAMDEAQGRGSSLIEPEHILLCMAREGLGMAGIALQYFSTLKTVHQHVWDMLDNGSAMQN